MISRKTLLLFSLIIVLLYIGFDLAPLLQKESLKDISFSDFSRSIGVALSGTAIFLGYRAEIKKKRNNEKQHNSKF